MSTERTDYSQMAQKLSEGRLGPEGFTHRAHLGVAYEILSAHEVFDAMAIYARGLRQLASAAGVPEKFNATVTLGFLSLTAERMANGKYDTAEAFLEGNTDLLAPAPLSPFYGGEILNSDLARRVPLLPRKG